MFENFGLKLAHLSGIVLECCNKPVEADRADED